MDVDTHPLIIMKDRLKGLLLKQGKKCGYFFFLCVHVYSILITKINKLKFHQIHMFKLPIVYPIRAYLESFTILSYLQ